MPDHHDLLTRRQELHQQWYEGPNPSDESRYRNHQVTDQWGIKCHVVWDANPMSLRTYTFSEDEAGIFHWHNTHTRTSTTYSLYPLNRHTKAQGWEVRIVCRGVMRPVTITSKRPGMAKAETIGSVHNEQLAFACAHEHIRRMSSHVIEDAEPKGEENPKLNPA